MKTKNLYRDFFLHFDILVMMILLVGFVSSVTIIGLTLFTLLCFSIGLVFFIFSEYLTHRFLFHLKAPRNPFFLKALKRLHYDHHKHPNDLKLLFLPIWYSIPQFIILSFVFYLFTRTIAGTLAFGIGLIVMLLIYEWRHYVAHRPIKPKTKFGLWVKKTHMLHHFKNENYWYGVSNPFVDVLFGTLKNQNEVENSETVKNLERRVQ